MIVNDPGRRFDPEPEPLDAIGSAFWVTYLIAAVTLLGWIARWAWSS